MTAALAFAPASAPVETLFDVLTIQREIPDPARAAEFDGHAMVQSFTVPLPDGRLGRCWITTAEAFRVERFGRGWVVAALQRHAGEHGIDVTLSALREGLRVRATRLDTVPD